ncbi:MAG: FG-GAP repeat domain-containing protein, partial [Myxococcales bacterium]
DLVHITTNPGNVITWLSQGDGSWDVVGFTSTGDTCLQGCGSWLAADVNGDGRVDLVHLTTNPGNVITWLSQGDGSWDVVGFTSKGDTCLQGCGIWEAADVNGDGRVDLVHVTSVPGVVITWLSNGDGTFSIPSFTSSGDQCLLDCGTWEVGDVNGDGKADLVHLTTNPGSVVTWFSKGDGSYDVVGFTTKGDTCLQGCGTWQRGDLNGDGKMDLIHLTSNPGQVISWLSNGDGSFQLASFTSKGDTCLQGCGSWQQGDLNGDGKVDLVHLTSNPGDAIDWLSNGDGTFNVIGFTTKADVCLQGCGGWL